jgi:hypothetical protein
MKPLILTFTFLLFTFTGFGQEKPQAELVDEFGLIGCEDVLIRTAYLMQRLENFPQAIGYVVTFGNKNKNFSVLYREMTIKGEIKDLRFDKTRIKFIRGKEESEIRNEFWFVPESVEPPTFKTFQYDFQLPKSLKPFIIFDDKNYGPCSSSGYENAYLEVLQSNPTARGNLVIQSKTRKEFYKRKKELLTQLSEISPKRLRFFYKKDDYLSVEYWIIPKKKRN